MTHNFGRHIDASSPVSTRRLALVAGLAAACFLVVLTAGVGQNAGVPVHVRSHASDTHAQSAHCSQFVELARAKYGAAWKSRLDPRDTLCAQQVQAVWEHDWRPREAAPDPLVRATNSLSPVLPKMKPASAPEQTATIETVPAVQPINTLPAAPPNVLASKPAEIVPAKAQPARAATYALAAVTAPTPTPPTAPTLPVRRAPKIEPPAVTNGGGAVEDGNDGARARAVRASSRADVVRDGSDATLQSGQSRRRSRPDDEGLRPRDDSGPAYADDDRNPYPPDDDAGYDGDPYPHDEDVEDDGGYGDDSDWGRP